MLSEENKITILLVRHENRFSHGLADCSLTNDGIYSSQHELIHKIVNIDSDTQKEIIINNIFSSPLIRTCQTIYPFAKKNNYLIKLEDSLYEYVNNWTSHYTHISKNRLKPMRIKHQKNKKSKDFISLYYNQHNYLSKIVQLFNDFCENNLIMIMCPYIKINKLTNTCESFFCDFKDQLNWFIALMNDDYYTYLSKERNHYESKIAQIIELMTFSILFIDGMLVNKIPDVKEFKLLMEHDSCYDIIGNYLDSSMKILESYDISILIDKSYKSIIDIYDHIEDNGIETINDVILRTSLLVNHILHEKKYQNSVYVSHMTTINSILINIFKEMYIDDPLKYLNSVFNISLPKESLEEFCDKNIIPIGSVHKVVIELDKKSVSVIKL